MNLLQWFPWYAIRSMTVPALSGRETAALAIVAASLLVYRTFRERYLLVWIVGWLAYLVARTWPEIVTSPGLRHFQEAISQAQFVLAIALFSASVFLYSRARKLMVPLVMVTAPLLCVAVLRPLYWPESAGMRLAQEICTRVVLLTASLQILRFRWARWDIGTLLVAFSLMTVHLENGLLAAHVPEGFGLFADLALGLGMLLVVFDDSRMRMRRLAVVNALTTSITRAQQYGPMMATALEELKGLMRADAAWFRLLEDDKMVLTQHIGLSAEFVRLQGSLTGDEILSRVIESGAPQVLRVSTATPTVRAHLRGEKFHHVVLVPILGKKHVIGMLALGRKHFLFYTQEEIEFLATAGQQLGLAVENLKLVEQILRSQRQWINTFESIQDQILVHDSDFRVIKANQALLQRLQQPQSEVVEKLCSEVLPRRQRDWTTCPYCRPGVGSFHEGPDPCFGGFSMVSSSSYTEQGSRLRGTIHVIRDLTDRRAAEEKYRLLFEQAQEGVFVAMADGKLLDCNDAFVRMLGYESREELETGVNDGPCASITRHDAFRREIELNGHVRNFEIIARRKDGSVMNALVSSFATRNSAGVVERYQGFLLDMTEKKRAEDEIRRRNRELNALNAMAVVATQSFDLDEILNLTLRQVISLFNAETGSVYLADPDQAVMRRRAGWGQRSEARAQLSEVQFSEGLGELVTRSRTEVITREFVPHLPAAVTEFLDADGMTSWIWVVLWSKDQPIGLMGLSTREAREYSSNDESLLVAIGRQLATTIEKVRLYEETSRAYEDLRRTQEQLLQSEKMSAVGQLISGVAHELNNPLTAILGYAQLLDSEGLPDRAAEFVGKLFKQAQRTHRVVQNLLSFARQRKPQKEPVDLGGILQETLTLRDYDLKINDIKLELEIQPDLAAVTADAHQLEQVFLNIINNAIDAILESGRGGALTVKVFHKEGYVYTEFHDSGPGIREPNRIFDPFYTTKSVGKGTGLGLSICYGIVKEHGGNITARNGEAGGAVIQVRLPESEHAVREGSLQAAAREVALDGRVLLVEDEEAVLEFERDVLAGAGATVTTLMDSDAAKRELADRRFDALIINGKMPGGWNAPQIYEWLEKNCPGMHRRLLFTFCSAPEPETRSFLQKNNTPSLVKPFEISELISHARRISQKTQSASAS
jgi:two-component system NtrC family sensor kinase